MRFLANKFQFVKMRIQEKNSLNAYSILSQVIIARFSKLSVFIAIRAETFDNFWSIYTIHHTAKGTIVKTLETGNCIRKAYCIKLHLVHLYHLLNSETQQLSYQESSKKLLVSGMYISLLT